MFCRLDIALYPLILAVDGNAQPGGGFGNGMASLRHLLNGFDLEFFGVSLTALGTS
jgi:hypothetical protein